MSTSWHNEYLSALATRDKTEHQNKALYEAYTTLASRKSQPSSTTKEEAAAAAAAVPPLPSSVPSSPSNRVISWSRSGGGNAGTSPRPTTPTPALAARWQEELSEAQRRRTELESGLGAAKAELERERARLVVVERRAAELAAENAGLTVKLRDRVEELRAKAKWVQDVHDESVTLNLQLNISEEQNAQLKKENKELVDRWMARMGKEADALNDASKF